MIFSGCPWCCDSDALDDGRQPGPISIGAYKLQRVTKVTKIGSERHHFACGDILLVELGLDATQSPQHFFIARAAADQLRRPRWRNRQP